MNQFCLLVALGCALFVSSDAFLLGDKASCRGRCHLTKPDFLYPCQCNDLCVKYENCCPDHEAICVHGGGTAPAAASTTSSTVRHSTKSSNKRKTCQGRCHLTRPDFSYPCQCNDKCIQFENCCPDHEAVCIKDTVFKLSTAPTTSSASTTTRSTSRPNSKPSRKSASCQGRCHLTKPDFSYPCQCNDLCEKYENCCPDHTTICAHEDDQTPTTAATKTKVTTDSNEAGASTTPSRTTLKLSSCQDRCHIAKPDFSYRCQCNDLCDKYENCCSDHQAICGDASTTRSAPTTPTTQSPAPNTSTTVTTMNAPRKRVVTTSKPATCQGRCDISSPDFSYPCQCNTLCTKYNNCCPDRAALCSSSSGSTTSSTGGTSCQSMSTLTKALWDADTDRLTWNDISLRLQGTILSDTDIRDVSSNKLFAHVDETKLMTPVFQTYMDLLNNFDPVKGHADTPTAQESAEEEIFIDALMSTQVWKTLFNYLQCRGKVFNMSELRQTVKRVWFGLYPRSSASTTLDTSGFEHVMVGEFKSSATVNGMHSWLSYYKMEQSGHVNYYGHYSSDTTHIVKAAFNWDGRIKALGSFFVGTSPAYDMAVYTLCYLVSTGQPCHVTIDGATVDITTYSTSGHLATAFVKA